MTRGVANFNLNWRVWEERVTGVLPPSVRRNMHIDLAAATLFGPFIASLTFLPVVMRRLGAPPEWLAFYAAQNFIGFLFTAVSVWAMPRRHSLLRFAIFFWTLSRGSFLLVAVLSGAQSLIWLTLWFWLMESFPMPAYTRLMQAAYPARSRGRVISLIRVGMSTANLAVTPLIGWLLDTAGHQVLYPLGSVFALVSVAVFSRLRFTEADFTESPPASGAGLWRLAIADRRFGLYLGALTLFGVGLLSSAALLPLVQVDRLGLTYGEIGGLSVVQSAFSLLGYMVWGRLIDRRGAVWAIRLVFLIAGVIPLSYWLASAGWMLAPAFAALGLVNAGMDVGMLTTVMQLAPAERLGEYSALQTTVLGLRGLAAPFIGVWLVQGLGWSFPLVFGLGLALILVSVVLLWRVRGERAAG